MYFEPIDIVSVIYEASVRLFKTMDAFLIGVPNLNFSYK